MYNKKFIEIADVAIDQCLNGDQLDVPKFVQVYGAMIVKQCSEIARLNTRPDSKVNLMIQEHFGVDDGTR